MLVIEGANQFAMRPRTLEEAIAYENFAMVRSGSLSIGVAIPEALAEAYEQIYERIKSSEFKKTDFAMNLLANTAIWTVPAYIADGLRWLELRLCGPAPKEPPTLKDTDGAAPALKSAGEAAA